MVTVLLSVMTAVNYAEQQGKLLKYATSGDVTGDNDAVVGYSSIAFV